LPEEARKQCLLALDAPQGPILCPLSLPADATVAAALSQARSQLQPTGIDAGIDWDGAATGVWGVRCGRNLVPRDGDRIELYRALSVDPRHRRRQRVRATRRT
jgi:putative ubiquitin-RnfH superfamily antitoxin RatB of RatAB toxin-antitoxin module